MSRAFLLTIVYHPKDFIFCIILPCLDRAIKPICEMCEMHGLNAVFPPPDFDRLTAYRAYPQFPMLTISLLQCRPLLEYIRLGFGKEDIRHYALLCFVIYDLMDCSHFPQEMNR